MVTEPPVRRLRERESSILHLEDSHQDPAALLAGKHNGEVGVHLHEEVPALALDRVEGIGMPTGCPPRADRVDTDGDVDVVLLKARRVIGPPFEAGLTHESIHEHTMHGAQAGRASLCGCQPRGSGWETEPHGAGRAGPLASTGCTAYAFAVSGSHFETISKTSFLLVVLGPSCAGYCCGAVDVDC